MARGAAKDLQAQRVLFERRLLGALANAPGATIADLADALGANRRRVERAVSRLVTEGRVDRRDGRLFIPGREDARGSTGIVVPLRRVEGGPLAPVLDALPTDAHRSFFRLCLGATIARHHLARHLGDGWPAGIVYGPTGAFKTAVGVVVARLLGQREESAVRVVGRETARSLLGRRRSAHGRMTFEPSQYLRGPVLVLDEADKAATALRSDLLLLLQGDSAMEQEGVHFTMRAAPLLTFNADHLPGWLHKAYLRRAFVLDTNGLASRRQVAEAARRLFAMDLPNLDLAALRPPIREVGPDDEAFLERSVGPWLTRRGTELFDARYISKAALGVVPMLGISLRRALVQVAIDYLACAATTGEARDGFADALAPMLDREAGAPPPAPAPADEPEEQGEPDAAAGIRWSNICGAAWAALSDGYTEAAARVGAEWTARAERPKDRVPSSFELTDDAVERRVRLLLGLPPGYASGRSFVEEDLRRVYASFRLLGGDIGTQEEWTRCDGEHARAERERAQFRLRAEKEAAARRDAEIAEWQTAVEVKRRAVEAAKEAIQSGDPAKARRAARQNPEAVVIAKVQLEAESLAMGLLGRGQR